MPRLLQINTTCNSGSHGRIAENIGELAVKYGWESYIAFGRGDLKDDPCRFKITSKFDLYKNIILCRLFDNDGFCSNDKTNKLLAYIDEIKPNIVQLHNLHGYYLNIPLLFRYLSGHNIPVVWTLHDCWPITGHCAHFEYVGCNRWEKQCFCCSQKNKYPSSILMDNSYKHFLAKKNLFSSIKNLSIITPSDWLKRNVEKSYLQNHSCTVIHNGIDLNIFKPEKDTSALNKYDIGSRSIILGVPSKYSIKRCMNSFIELSNNIGNDYIIVLIGLTKKQISNLPSNILGLECTEDIKEMVAWYSKADVFVNTSLEDTFPTTNLEALACGTPVVTFNTGGSPEAITPETGIVVPQNNIQFLKKAIEAILAQDRNDISGKCIRRAHLFFDETNCFKKYIDLYQQLIVK